MAVAPKLSVSEGAGKLLNYMATALPTVAFDTPVAREYLGIHGLFASARRCRKPGTQAFDALNGSASMETTGQRLRQRAIQLFNWQNAGQEIVALYQALVQHKKRSAKWRKTGDDTQVTQHPEFIDLARIIPDENFCLSGALRA